MGGMEDAEKDLQEMDTRWWHEAVDREGAL